MKTKRPVPAKYHPGQNVAQQFGDVWYAGKIIKVTENARKRGKRNSRRDSKWITLVVLYADKSKARIEALTDAESLLREVDFPGANGNVFASGDGVNLYHVQDNELVALEPNCESVQSVDAYLIQESSTK